MKEMFTTKIKICCPSYSHCIHLSKQTAKEKKCGNKSMRAVVSITVLIDNSVRPAILTELFLLLKETSSKYDTCCGMQVMMNPHVFETNVRVDTIFLKTQVLYFLEMACKIEVSLFSAI